MATQKDKGGEQAAAFVDPSQAFHTGPDISELLESHEDLREALSKQGLILAEHQGKFTGIFPSISAVQSSLGAWQSVVAVVTAMIIGLLIFNLTRTNSVGDRIADQTARIGGLDVRMGAIENQMDALPQKVAQELKDQSPSSPPISASR